MAALSSHDEDFTGVVPEIISAEDGITETITSSLRRRGEPADGGSGGGGGGVGARAGFREFPPDELMALPREGNLLGEGAFGKVYEVKRDGSTFAVKVP